MEWSGPGERNTVSSSTSAVDDVIGQAGPYPGSISVFSAWRIRSGGFLGPPHMPDAERLFGRFSAILG